jgi:hypothetical protein
MRLIMRRSMRMNYLIKMSTMSSAPIAPQRKSMPRSTHVQLSLRPPCDSHMKSAAPFLAPILA